MTEIIPDVFFMFLSLSWLPVIIGAVVAHFVGWFWYGTLFNTPYMRLTKTTDQQSNWHAVGVNFLGILALGYLIAVLSQFDTAVMLLGIDALLAVIIMMNLSNALFRFGNNKNAIQFWLITAGYEVIAVFIIAATIFALG